VDRAEKHILGYHLGEDNNSEVVAKFPADKRALRALLLLEQTTYLRIIISSWRRRTWRIA